MPAGDAQRVWFPEMIEDLKVHWSSSMNWEELAVFCRRMTDKRKWIRQSREIKPPMIRCSRCGEVSRSDIQGISIRSALFTLKKIGIVSETEFKKLERDWNKFKKKSSLDAYGNKTLELWVGVEKLKN